MKKTQPQQTATPPAAAPTSPSVSTYTPTHASRIAFILSRASADERKFFHELLDSWEEETYTLPEAAFMRGASACGITWIGDIEDAINDADLFRQLHLVTLTGGWLASFLRSLLKRYDYKNPFTPDDVAEDLEERLVDFQHEIRDARALIENHPETLTSAIRAAVQKHPGLLA